VMLIGPAGENLVRFACPVVDKYHVPGRSGAGAVMGAKKLKAIAVRGTRDVNVANPEKFEEAVKRALNRILGDPVAEELRELGALPKSRRTAESGDLPGKNYQTGILQDFVENLGMEAGLGYLTRAGKSEVGCPNCPVNCFNIAEVKTGKYAVYFSDKFY